MADGVMVAVPPTDGTAGRLRTADKVFYGCLAYTGALTVLWVFCLITGYTGIFPRYQMDADAVKNIIGFFVFMHVIWGFLWWRLKNALLRDMAGFSKEERQLAFSSRMKEPFDLPALLARHPERRIRIVDMIGRRGRFIPLQLTFLFIIYINIGAEPGPGFLTAFTAQNLFESVVQNWAALALYYSSHWFARMFWGAQTRVMDGTLGRANCLLITMLWSAFKFVMVPLGTQLALHFPPQTFAPLFMLIWMSYTAADASAEIVGSIFGRQKLRVWGMGDVNRKSIAGTVAAFLGSLTLCLAVVFANHLPTPWLALALVLSISNTFFELFSPRGTDDFTMATANALIVWGFGVLIY
jgi:hypothetical protein